jgi:hypothetical protein
VLDVCSHLLEADQEQWVCCGSSASDSGNGIYPFHAYTIIGVFEVFTEERGIFKLLKIRNPHGKGEWVGDWGDDSYLWTDDLKERVGYEGIKDEGIFFMSDQDYLTQFEYTSICYY